MELIGNPLAPVAFNGVVAQQQQQFVDAPYTYVFNYTVPADETVTNLLVSLDRDADFILLAVQIIFYTSASLAVQFSDNQGQNLSNDLINVAAFGQGPFAFVPGRIFAAGGKIGIVLQDSSGSDNSIQIAFRGIKRYRLN